MPIPPKTDGTSLLLLEVSRCLKKSCTYLLAYLLSLLTYSLYLLLLKGFAELLRSRGGNAGAANLYQAGSGAAGRSNVVDAQGAGHAATELLSELSVSARRSTPAASQPESSMPPPDLWDPDKARERAAAAR